MTTLHLRYSSAEDWSYPACGSPDGACTDEHDEVTCPQCLATTTTTPSWKLSEREVQAWPEYWSTHEEDWHRHGGDLPEVRQ